MNVLEKAIESSYGEISIRGREKLVASAMAYITKVIKSQDLSAAIREHVDPKVNATDFRKSLYTGYILKNVKLWIWHSIKNDLSSRMAKKAMADFLVHDEDYTIWRMLNRNKEYIDTLREMALEYQGHSLEKYNQYIDDFVAQMRATGYIDKFARRKLAFVYRSNNIGHDGMVNDLLLAGVLGIYRQYPCIESSLHMVNIGKQSIHNHGMNIINRFSSKGRSRLKKLDDGTFEATVVSDTNVNGEDSQLHIPVDEQDDMYDRAALNGIIDNYTGKKRQFLELMMGRYPIEFREWAKENGIARRDMDPENPNNTDNMKKVIGDYLSVSPKSVDSFLSEISRRL